MQILDPMNVSTFTANRQTLAAPGGDIAYTEFGDGPAALFVHGLATSGALWRNVIEQLAATSRCVAIDLPAHGGSQARKDASVSGMADAVAELCDGRGLGRWTWSATTPGVPSRRSSRPGTRN